MADKDDDTLKVDSEDKGQEDPASTDDDPQTFSREYVVKLRKSEAKTRVLNKELKQQIKDDETKRLEDDEQWRELAETRQRELDESSGYKEKYEDMLTGMKASNESRIESIPDNMQSLVPTLDPGPLAVWLDANEALLKKPLSPDLKANAGQNDRPADTAVLSEEQRGVARSLGVSEEDYLAQTTR